MFKASQSYTERREVEQGCDVTGDRTRADLAHRRPRTHRLCHPCFLKWRFDHHSCNRNLSKLSAKKKKITIIHGFHGTPTQGASAPSAALLYQLSCENPYFTEEQANLLSSTVRTDPFWLALKISRRLFNKNIANTRAYPTLWFACLGWRWHAFLLLLWPFSFFLGKRCYCSQNKSCDYRRVAKLSTAKLKNFGSHRCVTMQLIFLISAKFSAAIS